MVAQEIYLTDVEGALLQVDDQAKLLQTLEKDPQVGDMLFR